LKNLATLQRHPARSTPTIVAGLNTKDTPSSKSTASPVASIKAFALGPFATNTYVLWHDPDPACLLIDPSFEPAPVIAFVRENKLKPAAIVLTHTHVDHIAGIADVQRALGPLPVWVHQAEERWLEDPELNLSPGIGLSISLPPPNRLLRADEQLELSGHHWKILHVPGHSPGSIALYHEPSGFTISGDVLFDGTIGRSDFPGCDFATLERSIQTKLYTLPETTKVYPGHGPPTTIGHEKKTNPFVRPGN
jgi:hydroxyacylglutathione hydrolase